MDASIRKWKHWTDEEDNAVIRGYQEGTPIGVIAAQLRRSPNSISVRAHTLGISTTIANRIPHGVKAGWMSFRVTKEFEERYRRFCLTYRGGQGEVFETVMTAFMNQIEEDEKAHKHRR